MSTVAENNQWLRKQNKNFLASIPHKTDDNEPSASPASLPHSKCIPGLELSLAWYKRHAQLENHPKERCHTSVGQLRRFEEEQF